MHFEEVNKQLPAILLIGIALGIGHYAVGIWPTLGQSILQQVLISLVIGYLLLLVITNASDWLPPNISKIKKHALLVLCFSLIGILGAEVESLVRCFLFQEADYFRFHNEGGYLFNAILSNILGFSFYYYWFPIISNTANEEEEKIIEEAPTTEPPLTTIPIKQGESISLHALDNILYFEAYDNYSFLYDLDGKKSLCTYSLLFLEKKLPANFLRVHRKYLINKEQILLIQPHVKGRFVLTFKDKKRSTLTSSSSYTDVIKQLTKL